MLEPISLSADKPIQKRRELSIEKSIIDKVYAANANQCRYCGFTAKKFQMVHPRDGDLTKVELSKLLLACPYCYQSLHINDERVVENVSLIYFPQRDQAYINHISRLYHICKNSTPSTKTQAINTAFQLIKQQGEQSVKKMFGEYQFGHKTTSPAWLAHLMIVSQESEDYRHRSQWGQHFLNLRTLVTKDGNRQRLTFWKTITSHILESNHV